MPVVMGVALAQGNNEPDILGSGGSVGSLAVLAALDAHRNTLASALGVTGTQANLLYPGIVQIWCYWPWPSAASPPGWDFPSAVLMDGLRDRGITPMVNWGTLRGAATTTAAAAASGGATNIKVASVSGFFAGSAVWLPTLSETHLVASVGTSGSGGTGVTLQTPIGGALGNGAAVHASAGPATARRIVDGLHDAYIDGWAAKAAAWAASPAGQGITLACRPKSSRIIVRPDWEANGTWMPWRAGVMGTTDTNMKNKFRRLVNRVRAIAPNAEFHYCPMGGPGYNDTMAAQHPGDEYVAWVGFDNYDFDGVATSGQTTWSSAVTATRAFSSRPILIGETGGRRLGANAGTRSSWLTNGIAWADNQPDIAGICYFDMDVRPQQHHDWAITGLRRVQLGGSPTATDYNAPALQSGVQLTYAQLKLSHPGVL